MSGEQARTGRQKQLRGRNIGGGGGRDQTQHSSGERGVAFAIISYQQYRFCQQYRTYENLHRRCCTREMVTTSKKIGNQTALWGEPKHPEDGEGTSTIGCLRGLGGTFPILAAARTTEPAAASRRRALHPKTNIPLIIFRPFFWYCFFIL